MSNENEDDGWKIGNVSVSMKLSIGVLCAGILQLCVFVWEASAMNSRILALETFQSATSQSIGTLNSSEINDRENTSTRLTHLEDVTTSTLEIVKSLSQRRNLDPNLTGGHN